MKTQHTLITYTIILSSMVLNGFNTFMDQPRAVQAASAPADQAIEAVAYREDYDAISHFVDEYLNLAVRMREFSIAVFSETLEKEDTGPESEPVARLPMESQYHSQITETSLPSACGPTALLMTLDYFGLEDSLAAVIQKLQISPAQGGYDPYCTANPVCTSPGALVRIAREEYGLTVNAHEGWTLLEIQESLAGGQPIIADIVWRLADKGVGHFVVIYGIDTEEGTLFYHDPYDGAEKVASWEAFSVAWDGPVDQGDPLQPEGFKFWAMALNAN